MNIEEMKEAVKRLYSEVLLKGDRKAAEELMVKTYKQHNPQAKDGLEGLLEHVKDLDRVFPDRSIEFIHLFAEGDCVITHIHFTLIPGSLEAMGMDIFRFEGEKIAEHWDVIQAMPKESMNSNGMY